MNSTDLALLLGSLLSAWCVGFSAGFTITRFREALNHVS